MYNGVRDEHHAWATRLEMSFVVTTRPGIIVIRCLQTLLAGTVNESKMQAGTVNERLEPVTFQLRCGSRDHHRSIAPV